MSYFKEDIEIFRFSNCNYVLNSNYQELQKQINVLRSTNKLLDEMVSEKGINVLNEKITELQERVRLADEVIMDSIIHFEESESPFYIGIKGLKDYSNKQAT